MISNKERSHKANVANFEAMLTYIGSLGSRYNPGPDRQKLTYMQSRLTSTQDIMTALATAELNDTVARNNRRQLFETLTPLAVRVLRIFDTCDVSKDTLHTARAILKKIQGRRLTPVKDNEAGNENGEEVQEPVHHEAAQRSFIDMVDHLEHLIAVIATVTDYMPNEIELKKSSLESLLEQLKAANTATYTTGAALDNARLNRDRTLYREGDGLVKIAKSVKKYVVAIFGPTSTQSEKIHSFIFTDHDFDEVAETLPDPS